MDSVSKFNPHHDELGRFASSPHSGGGMPSRAVRGGGKVSAETKRAIDSRAKKVIGLIASDSGAETAERLAPVVKEAFKQFLAGNPSEPLVVNGNKVMNRGNHITAVQFLDSIAEKFGTESVTGISGADFASGDAFRRTVRKANPFHDSRGRFTSRGNARIVRPQRMTPQNAPTKLAAHLAKHGGFTYDPKRSQLRRKGFAVSVRKDTEQVIPEGDFAKSGVGAIKRYLAKHSEVLSNIRMHLGAWVDKGKVYLDTSTITRTPEEAADLGRKHNQIAFFDLATFTTWTRFRSAPDRPYRYLASGEQTRTAPIVGEVPIANIEAVGKVEPIDGVIFCPVDSLLDDASIESFVEQILAMTNISKNQPTSTDVHVPTIMQNRRRKRKTKKMMLSDVVEKKARLKDPKGGLTAAGRRHFKRTEGANLKPGVKGKADTPEKMRRKGSFLTRFFTNPSGPMVGDNGKPTRLALSAAAWGEPVPKTRESAARLAAKGRSLLERYERTKEKKVAKFNPNHDERGRFASAGGGGRSGVGVAGGRQRRNKPLEGKTRREHAAITPRVMGVVRDFKVRAVGGKPKRSNRTYTVSRYNPETKEYKRVR